MSFFVNQAYSDIKLVHSYDYACILRRPIHLESRDNTRPARRDTTEQGPDRRAEILGSGAQNTTNLPRVVGKLFWGRGGLTSSFRPF